MKELNIDMTRAALEKLMRLAGLYEDDFFYHKFLVRQGFVDTDEDGNIIGHIPERDELVTLFGHSFIRHDRTQGLASRSKDPRRFAIDRQNT